MEHTLYFDGLCLPNPGAMWLCCKVGNHYFMDAIGEGTINIAEWSALLWCLRLASNIGLRQVDLIGDSQLAINQANGVWQVKHPAMQRLKHDYDDLAGRFDQITIRYQPRLSNLAAMHLEEVLTAPPWAIAA